MYDLDKPVTSCNARRSANDGWILDVIWQSHEGQGRSTLVATDFESMMNLFESLTWKTPDDESEDAFDEEI